KNVIDTSMTVSWHRGDGSRVAVFMADTSEGKFTPNQSRSYLANAKFGDGDQIQTSGWYCVYDGTDSSVDVSGLLSGRIYGAIACEYNGYGSMIQYNTYGSTNNPVYQPTVALEPSMQATNINFSNVTRNSMDISWTRGNGSSVAVFMADTSEGNAIPLDDSAYTRSSYFGSGSQIGTSKWFCVYNGTDTFVDVSSLSSSTAYRVMVCEYNGPAQMPNYNCNVGTGNPVTQSTVFDEPSRQANNLQFSSVTGSSMTISWTRGDGNGTILLASATTNGSPYFEDGKITFTADTVFGHGTQVSDSWYCVYNGTGTQVHVTGLSANTIYRFFALEYNGTGLSSSYVTYPDYFNPKNQVTGSAVTQTITFNLGYDSIKSVNSPKFKLRGSSSSGLMVSYTSSNASVATISGDTVTITGSGTTVITASQAGGNGTSAAVNVSRNLHVGNVTFPVNVPVCHMPPSGPRPANLPKWADSLPIIIWNDPGEGDTFRVQISITSDFDTLVFDTVVTDTFAIISSNLDNDSNYHSRIAIRKEPGGDGPWSSDQIFKTDSLKSKQSISFALGSDSIKYISSLPFKLPGSVNTGLPLIFTSSNPAVATISHDTVTITGAGTTVITANQSGNAVYASAISVQQKLVVKQAPSIPSYPPAISSKSQVSDKNLDVPTSPSPVLQWNRVTEATSYHIQLGSASFQPIFIDTIVNDTSLILSSVTTKTAYCCRISAINNIGIGPWDTLKFTTSSPVPVSSPLIPAAAIITDDAADIDTLPAPSLFWNKHPDASSYHIQLNNTVSFESPVKDTLIKDTSLSLTALKGSTSYYCRIAAVNGNGTGPWDTLMFTTKGLPPSLPPFVTWLKDTTQRTATTIILDWNKVKGAKNYTVQYSTDQLFSTATIERAGINSYNLTIVNLSPSTTYFWRVCGENSSGQGPWSTVQVFTTMSNGTGVSKILSDTITQLSDNITIHISSQSDAIGSIVTANTVSTGSLSGKGLNTVTTAIDLKNSSSISSTDKPVLTVSMPSKDIYGNEVNTATIKQSRLYKLTPDGKLIMVYDAACNENGTFSFNADTLGTYIVAVDTTVPKLIDNTPVSVHSSGAMPVISGTIEDNVSNLITHIYFRKGGEYSFDSLPVTIDGDGKFTLPVNGSALDNKGFEYFIAASDGSFQSVLPRTDITVQVTGITDPQVYPSDNWRL
ncbi:MAG TPA: fibronectin type III domain-containing protein, partial [Chitinispirillaceae bacterium]|nr:fibronectin type III domain-containing protein [Chitinispirillaceae bacterium]